MPFLIGKKQYMTQIWGPDGSAIPATVISAGPVTVIQIKDIERDGYDAIQVGYGFDKKLNKPESGHLKELGKFAFLKEFRLKGTGVFTKGQKIDATVFKEGDYVTISGVSKGKGFQGVVKRHGFHGGSRTHGQKHSEREPGAIGGGARAGGRVAKGLRMAGRMGGDRVTVKNLKIAQIIPEENLILVKGAVPGRRGAILEIRGAAS